MPATINNLFFTKFQQILEKLNFFSLPQEQQKIAVAVSGGVDSMALAVLLQNFCRHFAIDLSALVVNHNYREKSALEAKQVCQQLQQLKRMKTDEVLLHYKERSAKQLLLLYILVSQVNIQPQLLLKNFV